MISIEWDHFYFYYERYQRILVREEIPSHALWQGTPAVISLTIKSHIQNKCEEVQENWTVLFWGISILIWTQNVKFHDLIYQRNWISTKTALIRICYLYWSQMSTYNLLSNNYAFVKAKKSIATIFLVSDVKLLGLFWHLRSFSIISCESSNNEWSGIIRSHLITYLGVHYALLKYFSFYQGIRQHSLFYINVYKNH